MTTERPKAQGPMVEDEEAFWGRTEQESLVVREEPGSERIYNLEERTARFGKADIRFTKRLPFTPVNSRLIDQLVGAAPA